MYTVCALYFFNESRCFSFKIVISKYSICMYVQYNLSECIVLQLIKALLGTLTLLNLFSYFHSPQTCYNHNTACENRLASNTHTVLELGRKGRADSRRDMRLQETVFGGVHARSAVGDSQAPRRCGTLGSRCRSAAEWPGPLTLSGHKGQEEERAVPALQHHLKRQHPLPPTLR